MSKYKLSQTLQKELRNINTTIDLKIVRGLSYKREAMRHKYVFSQLARLRPASLLFFF